MVNVRLILIASAWAALIAGLVHSAEDRQTLDLENFNSLNRKITDSGSVWYGYGDVRLRIDSTRITADSMAWYRDYSIIHFWGRVEAYDSVQHIWAKTVTYLHDDSTLMASGDVTVIHRTDSIKTQSQWAQYDRSSGVIHLEGEPRLYLNYPDTANLVEITAKHLTFHSEAKSAEAQDSVVINYQDVRATAGCAEFSQADNLLTLRDEPYATQDSSDIKGQLMEIRLSPRGVRQIDVFDDAVANFVENADSASGELSGRSLLFGKTITFYFKDDKIRKIAAMGSSRSEYLPSPDDTTGAGKNFVSGDTIYAYVENRRVSKIEIVGGAEGVYVTEGKVSDSTATDSAMSDQALSGDTLKTPAEDKNRQETGTEDTLRAALPDSLASDSLTAKAPPEDSIHYRGRFLEYFAHDRIIRVNGNAHIRQGQVVLDAEQVDYDVPKRVVVARAKADSVDTNALTPVALTDGSEKIFGSKLVFNVDTRQGLIENATTQYEQAYYRGKDLFKEEEKVFYVESGRLTSCELEEPHFHFRSNRMKIIHNDRVIARPVVLYIETLPVLGLPYYVFPLKRGRHSGILPIRLGNFEKGNRFIGNIGYYWAASEYWDVQTSLDYFENTGIIINGGLRYNKRYAFFGNISGSYTRDRREFAFGESQRDRWLIQGDHSQTLPYDVDFKASGYFVSDRNYSSDYLTDPDERRNRNIISKANFSKRFGRASLSLSFSHTNNIDTDSRSSTLPQGSLTMPSFQAFGGGREVDGQTIKKWYNEFYVGYNNNFSLTTERHREADSSRTGRDFAYVNHNASISSPQKIFKYIDVGPRVSLTETWYYIMDTEMAGRAGIPANRAYRRGAISAGVNSSSDMAAIFPINVLGLLALRHQMSPSISFSWSPAVTKNNTVRNYTNVGGGGGRQMSLGFGLQNLIGAKVKTGETENKLDLLRINSGFSYNFQAKDKKFSTLSTSLASTVLKNVSIDGSLVHDLYDKSNKLNWWSPSLESFSISTRFQARGSVGDDYVRQGLEPIDQTDTLGMDGASLFGASTSAPSGTGTGGGPAWNLNLSHYYSESRSHGKTMGRIHWISVTFSVDLTTNWKLKYSQTYDLVRHESVDKVVDLYRRIHCWEGHFYWIPNGSRQGYYFKINVIAIPDLKLEKSESGLRGALFGR